MTDKTAEVPGGDGQYYFGTTFKSRNFKVDFVFNDLNDTDIRNLKRLFSGDGLHDLIFDETPYKAWRAKVTGTPTLKYIPFDDGDSRIYKGEGSLTFTCYDPFAHTPKKLWAPNQDNPDEPDFYYGDLDGKNSDSYSIEAYPNKDEWLNASGLDDTITTIKGDVPTTAIYTLNCNTITNFKDNHSRITYLIIR
jgi:predicted phage tail component-like protein